MNKIHIMIALIAILLISTFSFIMMNKPKKEHDKIEDEKELIVREWTRLSPFPHSTTRMVVSEKGTMFSREFEGGFYAEPTDLEKWVEASPGLYSAIKENISSSTIQYKITPAGGAAFAEVIIDFITGEVKFKVFWS